MSVRTHGGMLGLSLVGLVLMFAVGNLVFLQGDVIAVLSPFELYAIAFTTGVWSMIVVAFVLNYVSVHQLDTDAISFDPRTE